jgi:hypothetical protein
VSCGGPVPPIGYGGPRRPPIGAGEPGERWPATGHGGGARRAPAAGRPASGLSARRGPARRRLLRGRDRRADAPSPPQGAGRDRRQAAGAPGAVLTAKETEQYVLKRKAKGGKGFKADKRWFDKSSLAAPAGCGLTSAGRLRGRARRPGARAGPGRLRRARRARAGGDLRGLWRDPAGGHGQPPRLRREGRATAGQRLLHRRDRLDAGPQDPQGRGPGAGAALRPRRADQRRRRSPTRSPTSGSIRTGPTRPTASAAIRPGSTPAAAPTSPTPGPRPAAWCWSAATAG